MKRLLIFFLLLFSLARGEAQTTTTSDRVVTKSLYLRDWWVDSVKRDTNFLGAVRSIPTAAAVYNFVAGRGAPGYTSVTSLPDSSGLIFHGPNGVKDTVVFEGETGGSGSSLPSMTGNAGKVLTTDGTTASWGTVSGGATTTTALTDVSDAVPSNNSTLVYNQDSLKYVPTQVVPYEATGLQNWDKWRYNSTTGQWNNYRSTYTTSAASLKMLVKDTTTGQEYHTDIPTGGSGATIARQDAPPTDGTTMYFNTLTHKFGIKNDEGTYWLYFTPSDSALVTVPTGPGTESYVTWSSLSGSHTVADNGLTAASSSAWSLSRGVETIAQAGQWVSAREGDGVNTRGKIVGLTTNALPTTPAHFTFAIYAESDGNLYKAESGAYTAIGTYAASDYFRVWWSGSNILYQKSADGVAWTTVHTSTGTPSGSYYIAVGLNTTGGAPSSLDEIKALHE
jgi:hypothetical protein